MQYNPINTVIWNQGANPSQQQRNEKYHFICEHGFNSERHQFVEPEDLDTLINLFKAHGTNGKLECRLDAPNNTNLPFGLKHNSVLLNIKPLQYRLKHLPDAPDWKLALQTTDMNIQSLTEAREWMKTIQRDIDPKFNYTRERREREDQLRRQGKLECDPSTMAVLVLTFANYHGITCANKRCRAPHYEHIVKTNSFHVCPCCGEIYKDSNVQAVPSISYKEDGSFDKFNLNCAVAGQTTMPTFIRMGKHKIAANLEDRQHAARANMYIKAKIGRLCDFLNCDCGDGYGHIREWAGHKLDKYQQWLRKENKKATDEDEQSNKRLKFGHWQNAAMFVWLSILAFEKRTYQTTVWSLSTICKEASKLQDGDEYIPNYSLKKRKQGTKVRKTRALNLKAVHRYTEELKSEWPEFERWCGDLDIPALGSIECSREENAAESVNAFIEFQGKKMNQIVLPGEGSWELDIVLVNSVIKISPDPGGVGFNSGLKEGDILREVNGLPIGKTVDEVFDLIVEQKQSKKIKTLNGMKPAPVKLTILR